LGLFFAACLPITIQKVLTSSRRKNIKALKPSHHENKLSPFLSPNKKILSQTQKKIAGSHVGTLAALAKNPYAHGPSEYYR